MEQTQHVIEEGRRKIALVFAGSEIAQRIAALPVLLDALEMALADLRQLSDPDTDATLGKERPSVLEILSVLEAAGVNVK